MRRRNGQTTEYALLLGLAVALGVGGLGSAGSQVSDMSAGIAGSLEGGQTAGTGSASATTKAPTDLSEPVEHPASGHAAWDETVRAIQEGSRFRGDKAFARRARQRGEQARAGSRNWARKARKLAEKYRAGSRQWDQRQAQRPGRLDQQRKRWEDRQAKARKNLSRKWQNHERNQEKKARAFQKSWQSWHRKQSRRKNA